MQKKYLNTLSNICESWEQHNYFFSQIIICGSVLDLDTNVVSNDKKIQERIEIRKFVAVLLWMNSLENSFELFFYSFKHIRTLNFIERSILSDVIVPSMSFFMVVFWLVVVYHAFNLFLSLHKYVCCQ